MSEFFNNIPKIAYEGKDSKNPLAFKFYNPDEVIAGKTMREQLKFALSWWHTMGGDGTDMFGCGTTNKTWGCDDVTARAKAKVEALTTTASTTEISLRNTAVWAKPTKS